MSQLNILERPKLSELYDVIVIGAGPAGLTAGLYRAQAGLRVVALEAETFGGQVMNIEKIENSPGFSEGVSGGSRLGPPGLALFDLMCGWRVNLMEILVTPGVGSWFRRRNRI